MVFNPTYYGIPLCSLYLTGFLEDKTGVTGAGTLLVGLAAYMVSKEIYTSSMERWLML